MFDISPLQIVILLAVVLLIVGPRRVPEVGRMMGRGLREFRESVGRRQEDPPVPTVDPPSAP